VVNRREWFHLFLAGSHFSRQQQQHCTYIIYIYAAAMENRTTRIRSS
jgi:hypothetical protein